MKEVGKTGDWLELLADSGCVSEKQMEPFLGESQQLIAIFTTIDKNSEG